MSDNKLFKILQQNNADWKEVIQICKTQKHYAKRKDWKNRTPLHIACLNDPLPPLNALKAILKANKAALLSSDDDGMLPIHYVCGANTNSRGGESEASYLNVLKVLIRFCPESILSQDRDRRTPLHRCCESVKSLTFFKCLLDSYRTHYVDGELTEVGSTTIVTVKDGMRRTALHFAVMNSLDEDILIEMMDFDPRVVEMEDVRGFCPLHYACSHLDVYKSTIHLLIERSIRPCRIRGNSGLSCLDLLTRTYKNYLDGDERLKLKRTQCSQNSIVNDENKKFSEVIDEYWEKSIMIAIGISGRLVDANTVHRDVPFFFHDLVRLDRCPSILIALALAKYPRCLKTKDLNGNLPLHTVASKSISRRCRSNHSQISRIILHGSPDACKEKNDDGKYPLNLAVESTKRWTSGVQEIFDVFPEAIDSLDLDIRFYPYIFSRASADISKLHKLITHFPNVLK